MRWKAVGPFIVISVILSLLTIFFLDSITKLVLVKSGQKVFGAKVQIGSLDIKLRDSVIHVEDVQVADRSEPMKNLFEFENGVFDLAFLPLLEKKVVINEATLEGLKFGTPRKISGALPQVKKKPSQTGKAAKVLWTKVESFSLERWATLKKDFDPKNIVNPEELESVKVAEETKTYIKKLPEEFNQQIDQLDAERRVKDLRRNLDVIKKKGGNVLVAAAEKLKAIRAVRRDLGNIKNEIEGTRNFVLERIRSAENLVKDVKKAKERDWQKIRSQVQLPSLDTKSMARILFGPAVISNVDKVLKGVELTRKYLPPKSQKPPPPPRGEGRIVEFPKERNFPRFLLVQAKISGVFGKDNPLDFKGTLEGITSNPVLYGKPAQLELKGSRNQRSLYAKIRVDHTGENNKESLEARYTGIPLRNVSVGDDESFGLLIKQGLGSVLSNFSIEENNIRGHIQFEGKGLSAEPRIQDSGKSDIVKRLRNKLMTALSRVDQITVGARLAGTFSQPTFDLESNLGSIVSKAVKDTLGDEINDQKKRLEAELNRITQRHIAGLEKEVRKLKEKYLSQLVGHNKIVDDLLAQVKKEASKSILPRSVPKTEEVLDQLKGIFGK